MLHAAVMKVSYAAAHLGSGLSFFTAFGSLLQDDIGGVLLLQACFQLIDLPFNLANLLL